MTPAAFFYDAILPLISPAAAVIAIIISSAAFCRAMVNQVPAVELIADEKNRHEPGRYNIRVENSMRHSVYLDHIEVLEPDPDDVQIWHPSSEVLDTINRSIDQLGSDSQTSSNPNRRKAVFLCVPPGQKQDLHVHVKSAPSNAIRLRLRWSPHLPYPVRLFIREQITADSKRLKSMRLSADTKAKPSTQ